MRRSRQDRRRRDLGSAALLAFGPTSFRDATTSAREPRKPVAEAPEYLVSVTPGDAEVPKGGVDIEAQLAGFTSEFAEVVYRATFDGRVGPAADGARYHAGRFTSRIFDLAERTEYFVEASGVRSPAFHLGWWTCKPVARTDATIGYPNFTGLPAEVDREAGDLTVLRAAAPSAQRHHHPVGQGRSS
ncbi:MAG: hypothetical protein R2882_04935 [Gemmatimonadales bacterium]